jgi:hypothetical protein
MTQPSTHTESEKIRALGAVGFELRMMAHASALRRQAERTDDDPMAQNAYIDSASLHARALIEFFLGTGQGRGSDVRRTDFATDWTPQPSDAVKRLQANYQLLHKYLAHLTWERVDPSAPPWTYPNIANDIIEVADAWSQHLASESPLMGIAFEPSVQMARGALNTQP